MADNQFDSAFYHRFYVNRRTQVTTPAEMARRASLIAAAVQHLEVPVRRILDAGCGLGWMQATLRQAFPRATYQGLEVSEHLCHRHGWTQGSVANFRPRGRFDLVVCYDVLQYLTDRDAVRAIVNLGRLSRGALYFDVPTLEDWRHNADRSRSDGAIHLRDAAWYRHRLARQFRHVGFGVHVRRGVSFVQWELERAVSGEKSSHKKRAKKEQQK
jgi:predicted TPR repeat methyltransferase